MWLTTGLPGGLMISAQAQESPSFAIKDDGGAVEEGDSGTTAFRFEVERLGGTSGAVTVDWAVTGSGTNPADAADFGEALPAGTLEFADGEAVQVIVVNVLGDTLPEPDEEFAVTLSNPSPGITIAIRKQLGTIATDDTGLAIEAISTVKPEGNSGTTPFTFFITRSGLISSQVTVDWAVVGTGDILADADDFGGAFPSGTVSFAPGETTKTVTVNVSGDTDIEPDETFLAYLSNPTAAATITGIKDFGTIQADDSTLAIAPISAVKSEGNSGSMAFTFGVTMSGGTTGVVTVDWAVSGSGSSPADADDFGGALPTGTLSFVSGETVKTITVNVTGDTVLGPEEGFTVTLTNVSSNSSITTATATGRIREDDTALVISAVSATKPEGNSGLTAFTFEVIREGVTTSAITASWEVAGVGGNPADADDFGGTLPTGTVRFAFGETAKIVTINVSGDTTLEPDEGFTVTLSNVSTKSTIATATAAGSIQADDSTLDIAAISASHPEGNSGSTAFIFDVVRSGATADPVTVDWAVTGSGGNPADGADFGGAFQSGTIHFALGETTKTITVIAFGDTLLEPDEGFTVTLSNVSSNSTITTATATGEIQSDDAALAIAATSASHTEGNSGTTDYIFDVTRSGLTSSAVSASWGVTGSVHNPTDGADFGGALPSGTLDFAAGETLKTITVSVPGDDDVEPDEGFLVVLSRPSEGVILTNLTAAGTIRNDDTGIAIVADAAVLPEGDSGTTPFTFDVIRTGATAGISSADWLVTGTGARPADAADFGGELPFGAVTFTAGETTRRITINVSGDTEPESAENFTVTLRNASGAMITTAEAPGAIQTDDVVLAIATPAEEMAEGNTGSTAFIFTVTRTGPASDPISVSWSVAGFGASPADSTDFGGSFPSGTLNFAAGETAKDIIVNISGDTTLETDEGFVLSVTNSSLGITLVSAGTIRNDDIGLAIQSVSAAKDEGNTDSTAFTFIAVLSEPVSSATSVKWTVVGRGENPVNGADFGGVLAFGAVNFAAGQTSETVTVNVSGDTEQETDEGFEVVLFNPLKLVITTASAEGTIRNDDLAIPAIPTDVAASDGSFPDRIGVTWSAASAASSYEVYRSTSEIGARRLIGSPGEPFFDDTNVALGDTFFYSVKAVNTSEASEFSALVKGRVATAAADVPADVSASDGTFTDKIVVTWSAVPGATSYKVYRATSAKGTKLLIGSPAEAVFEDTGVQVGDTFFYFVRAVISTGISDFSAAARGSAQDMSKGVPTRVLASDGTFLDKIVVSWIGVAGANSYQVFRSSSPEGLRSLAASLAATTFDDFMTATDAAYYYWVKSVGGTVASDFSDPDRGFVGAMSETSDNFAYAEVLTGRSLRAVATNTDATAEPEEPAHAGSPGAASIWWLWTAPKSGPVRVSTEGSSFDTVLAVYIGDSLSSLVEVASNDDGKPGLTTSNVFFTAEAEQAYRIAVDGFDGAAGDISLSLTLGTAAANDVVADFDAPLGLWVFLNGNGPEKINSANPVNLVVADVDGSGRDDVLVDFGAGFGVWIRRDDNGWSRFNAASTVHMATGDLNGNGKADVLLDFGPEHGTWVKMDDATWEQFNVNTTGGITVGDLDGNGLGDVLIDLGSFGVWVKKNNDFWEQLNEISPSHMTTGDMDDNGKDEAILDLGEFGIWVKHNDNNWEQIHESSSEGLVTGDLNGDFRAELIADFGVGSGLWRYGDGEWLKIHDNSPTVMAVGDVDGNGQQDLVADFGPGFGLWTYFNDSEWIQTNVNSASLIAVGNIDGK